MSRIRINKELLTGVLTGKPVKDNPITILEDAFYVKVDRQELNSDGLFWYYKDRQVASLERAVYDQRTVTVQFFDEPILMPFRLDF